MKICDKVCKTLPIYRSDGNARDTRPHPILKHNSVNSNKVR